MLNHNNIAQPFLTHLFELRNRLLRVIFVVFFIFLIFFPFSNTIYLIVAEPLMQHLPKNASMIATEVASPFLTPIKLSLIAALFFAVPFIFHQLWAFIAPGLYKHEQRMVLPLIISSTILFHIGIVFTYFIIFPLIFAFFIETAPEGVAVMTDIGLYLDFILTLFFAFGIAFEVPIATIILCWTGVTTTKSLAKNRSYIIITSFIIAMFLTPPDIISQTLLALPMWILFEIGLFFARKFQYKIPIKQTEKVKRYQTSPEEMKKSQNRVNAHNYQYKSDLYADMLNSENESEGNIENIFTSKIYRVMRLRDIGDNQNARKLLYEILAEGNKSQVTIAKNILQQLDN